MTTHRLAACLLIGLVVGCTSPSKPGQEHPAEKKSEVVGMNGGTVQLSSGSGVSIPPGALPDNTNITAEEAPDSPPPMDTTVVGTPVVFGPEGQQFTQPVTVTLSFDVSKLPAGTDPSHIVVFTAPVGSMTFTSLGGTLVDSTHIAAQTTHFSVFVPGVADSANGCAVCAAGRCAASCPTGTANCDGTCRETQHDSQNCGSCGHACGQDEGCFQGTCVPSCSKSPRAGCESGGPNGATCCTGFTMCSNRCVDMQSDPDNCGACGQACAANQQCVSGSCAPLCANGGTCFQGLCAPSCPSGTTSCSGACTDTQRDPQNCGACGQACGQDEGCFQGACVPSCGRKVDAACGGRGTDGSLTCCEGFTVCGQNCADLQNDHQNCGTCGNACGDEETCHAGTCGPLCAGSAICFQGLCVANCPTGSALCGGSCVDSQNDSQHCGNCDTTCASGQACFQGACVNTCGSSTNTDGGIPKTDGGDTFPDGGGHSGPCQSDSDCGTGGACVGGQCVPRGEDGGSADCHQSGCPSGQSCYPDGVCRPGDADGGLQCPPQNQCGGQCTDISSDRHNCGGCGQVCSVNELCSAGHCTSSALDGGHGGQCTSDADCGTGGACVGGQCMPRGQDGGATGCQQTGCPNGFRCMADGSCQPTATDGGVSCPVNQCNGQCTDTRIDRNNCGACNHVCGSTESCQNSTCVPQGTDAGTSTGCQQTGCSAGFRCMADGSCQPTATDGGVSCPVSQCNGQCTDTRIDRNNCGTCNHICGPTESCQNSTCVPQGTDAGTSTGCQQTGCPSGFQCMADGSCQPAGSDGGLSCPPENQCNGTCTNISSDPANCGACGHACAPTEMCQARQCVAPGTDAGTPTGCQATGCPSGFQCMADGSCQPSGSDGGLPCPPEFQCNGQCTNINSDPSNCGACGHSCGPTEMCQARQCVASGTDGGTPTGCQATGCPNGLQCMADGSCQATTCANDQDCGPNAICVGGVCKPAGPTDGGGPMPCQINSQCSTGQVCFRNSCVPGEPTDGGTACPPPSTLCSEACVDFSSDVNNCGTCGNVCPAGDYCGAGVCQTGGATDGGTGPMCHIDMDCGTGASCIGGFCSPNQSDGGMDGGTAPVVCNDIANVASVIDEMQVAADPPTYIGGTIVPGTYVQDSRTIYTGINGASGPTGNHKQTTVVLGADGTSQLVNGIASSVPTLSFKFTPSGNHLNVDVTCPAGQVAPPFMYTATSTDFTLFDGQHEEHFVLQP